MKFNFLKFKKKGLPSLKSLQPPIFDVNLFWFIALGLGLVIFVATTLVGFKLFYSQYFESYKKSASTENFGSIIDISKLKNAIEKRNNFINKPAPAVRDPSL